MTFLGATLTPPCVPIWRVGRSERPWEFTDWMWSTNGRFYGRFDDPQGLYRVVYAATDRVGAFLEALRDFRLSESFASELDEYGPADAIEPGVVPRSWLSDRWIASAVLKGRFADIHHSEWVGYLHRTLGPRFAQWHISELDGGSLRSTTNEDITRTVSRLIYEATEGGQPLFAGIGYESRFGSDLRCWAVFEHPEVAERPWTGMDAAPIDAEDADLSEACRIHGIRLEAEREASSSRPMRGTDDERSRGGPTWWEGRGPTDW